VDQNRWTDGNAAFERSFAVRSRDWSAQMQSKEENMARKRVADVLLETLVAEGVQRVYGLVGHSLNGVADSIRPRKELAGNKYADAESNELRTK
jgi:hypothetical protein